MAQYINKDSLVVKIENRIKELQNLHKENEKELDSIQKIAIHLCVDECKVILSLIDTFEVKEVDLEKELIKWHKEHFKKDGTFIRMSGFYLTNNSQMDIAKHFFELGLKTSCER